MGTYIEVAVSDPVGSIDTGAGVDEELSAAVTDTGLGVLVTKVVDSALDGWYERLVGW